MMMMKMANSLVLLQHDHTLITVTTLMTQTVFTKRELKLKGYEAAQMKVKCLRYCIKGSVQLDSVGVCFMKQETFNVLEA